MSNRMFSCQIEHPEWINWNGRKRKDHYTKQIKRFTRRRIRQMWRIYKKDEEKFRYGWQY